MPMSLGITEHLERELHKPIQIVEVGQKPVLIIGDSLLRAAQVELAQNVVDGVMAAIRLLDKKHFAGERTGVAARSMQESGVILGF